MTKIHILKNSKRNWKNLEKFGFNNLLRVEIARNLQKLTHNKQHYKSCHLISQFSQRTKIRPPSNFGIKSFNLRPFQKKIATLFLWFAIL